MDIHLLAHIAKEILPAEATDTERLLAEANCVNGYVNKMLMKDEVKRLNDGIAVQLKNK